MVSTLTAEWITTGGVEHCKKTSVNAICKEAALMMLFFRSWTYKCTVSRIIQYSYRQTSIIRRTLVGNKIVDHSDVAGASPVGAAPTTSSFST